MLRIILSALLLVASPGCGEPAAKVEPSAPTPSAPVAAPESPPTCTHDSECTEGWNPSVQGCGSIDRCIEGQCRPPAAATGRTNLETGRLVFESLGAERTFQVELVNDRFEVGRGLMCRQKMQPDWGMLFFMGTSRVQRFWMKNTLIPLDMVFLDERWQVVGVVARTTPHSLETRGVERRSRYVLELVAGAAGEAGVQAGTTARFYPPIPR